MTATAPNWSTQIAGDLRSSKQTGPLAFLRGYDCIHEQWNYLAPLIYLHQQWELDNMQN